MGTKTISLSDDAYERLKRLKNERESFSDVVLRLTGRGDLLGFAGKVSAPFADELEQRSASFRDRFDQDARRRIG